MMYSLWKNKLLGAALVIMFLIPSGSGIACYDCIDCSEHEDPTTLKCRREHDACFVWNKNDRRTQGCANSKLDQCPTDQKLDYCNICQSDLCNGASNTRVHLIRLLLPLSVLYSTTKLYQISWTRF